MKKITVLGSSGSIGRQTLEVIDETEGLSAFALSVNKSTRLLEEQVRKYKPKYACVVDETAAKSFKTAVADTSTKVLSGTEGLLETASLSESDVVVTAIVGIAGLLPTMEAIKAKKRIALANKETLVTAGKIVMEAAKKYGAEIIPVDSEHSAVFQSLGERYKDGKNPQEVKNIILTASGGPFFGKTRKDLENVTVKDALKHPNWSMGAKITVDSATLMNKGLEVIEATQLFGVEADRIKVLVHRQSIVHSMVELTDNAIIAQLGAPDMKLPIQYAITYPERKPMLGNMLDLAASPNLTFEKPDMETFRCLKLSFDAIKKGKNAPVVLNGANEAAVDLFLNEKIGFLDIADLVEKALTSYKEEEICKIDDVLKWDSWAREKVLADL